MSDPTCCSVSLDRCDRCDLLVDLEGFQLVAATRPECALVLDIDSCDRCAGCPGCGVNRSRSRARGSGGDRRALGQGSRQGSGGTIRRWMCRKTTCQTVIFLGRSEKACAPRAHLGVRATRTTPRSLHGRLGSPDQAATTSLPSPRGIPTSPLPLMKHTNYRPQRLKRQSGTTPPTGERLEI